MVMPKALRDYWAKKNKTGKKGGRKMARKYYAKRRSSGRGKGSIGLISAIGVGAGIAKILMSPAPAYPQGKSVVQDIMAGAKDPNIVNKVVSHMADWKTWVLIIGVPVGSKIASKFAGRMPLGKRVHVLG